MNKALLNEIRATLTPILDAAGEDMNLSISLGACTYDPAGNATFKLEVSKVGEDGNAVTPDALAFTRYADGLGMDPEWLHSTVNLNGEDHEIVGLRPRSHKYPVLAKRLRDGKTYKYPAAAIVRARPTAGV